MKNLLFTALVFLLGTNLVAAQIKTMFVHKDDGTISKYSLSSLDSITYDAAEYCAPKMGEMVDSRDSNVYATVTICNQTWMAENLRYDVPGVYGLSDTINPNSPRTSYGRLYGWATVMNGASSSNASPSGVQGICPNGWHLPSDEEWKTLQIALGMSQADANKTGYRGTDEGLRMKSILGWNLSNGSSGNGTNASGFSAFPAGTISTWGNFSNLGTYTYFCSSTEGTVAGQAFVHRLSNIRSMLYRRASSKTFGASCRCVKN
jgi:uncharacterized protein (TIGR02145 family)